MKQHHLKILPFFWHEKFRKKFFLVFFTSEKFFVGSFSKYNINSFILDIFPVSVNIFLVCKTSF